jgi:hypothetical protein
MDPPHGEYQLLAASIGAASIRVGSIGVEHLIVVGTADDEQVRMRIAAPMGQDAAEKPMGHIGVRIGIGETEGGSGASELKRELVLFESDEKDESEVVGEEIRNIQIAGHGLTAEIEPPRGPVTRTGEEKIDLIGGE